MKLNFGLEFWPLLGLVQSVVQFVAWHVVGITLQDREGATEL